MTKASNKYKLPEVSELHEMLDADFNKGTLRWKRRADRANWWNAKYAGKPAFFTVGGDGYYKGRINSLNISAHRVIWAMYHGSWAVSCVDHVNGNITDNRIQNLRAASRSQNQMNRKKTKSRSRFKGVFPTSESNNRWGARITIKGKLENLGKFEDEESAARAYDRAATAHYGDFSLTNAQMGLL